MTPQARRARAARRHPAPGLHARGGAGPLRRRARAARRPAHAAPGTRPIRCAIVTVSDTRARADDRSGDLLQRRIVAGGHAVASRDWVRDEVAAVRRCVRAALARRAVDAVLVTGGTGVAPRDVTPEAVAPLVRRWLPGFGELFRMLSYREVGAAAWLSRAAAGITRGKLLVILPGSPAAVRLAADRLLVPELAHASRLLGRLNPGE